MKHLYLILLLPVFICLSCEANSHNETTGTDQETADARTPDTLYRFSQEPYEFGQDFGYLNQHGDTIIPFGQYQLSYTDTIFTLGIVMDGEELIGINPQGEKRYEIMWFDNGPDYPSEGLFRILRDGKIGYADTAGEIVIEPQFACAFPFDNGRARVAYECEKKQEGEHTLMESEHWQYIDQQGQIVKQTQ